MGRSTRTIVDEISIFDEELAARTRTRFLILFVCMAIAAPLGFVAASTFRTNSRPAAVLQKSGLLLDRDFIVTWSNEGRSATPAEYEDIFVFASANHIVEALPSAIALGTLEARNSDGSIRWDVLAARHFMRQFTMPELESTVRNRNDLFPRPEPILSRLGASVR